MLSTMEKTARLRTFAFQNYKKFDECMKIFTRAEYKLIHNKFLSDKFGFKKQSFVGTKNCGSACFIMKYLLEKEDYDVKVIRNSRRTEFGLEDHVFLEVDNNIFDPTYRQFMIDNRRNDYLCLYKKHLFFELQPFLIHNIDDIKFQLSNSLDVNKFVYKDPFTTLEELLVNWEYEDDVTEKFNLHDYVNNKDLLKDKPDYYSNLINEISS